MKRRKKVRRFVRFSPVVEAIYGKRLWRIGQDAVIRELDSFEGMDLYTILTILR
jgi:hypothetical protein